MTTNWIEMPLDALAFALDLADPATQPKGHDRRTPPAPEDVRSPGGPLVVHRRPCTATVSPRSEQSTVERKKKIARSVDSLVGWAIRTVTPSF